MTRYEIIRMLVLNEISDDYEEPRHIYRQLIDLSGRIHMPIDFSDVEYALGDLVRLGWARAYRLSSKHSAEEFRGDLSADCARDFYYWITEEGRAVQSSFPGWPIDDDGNVLPQWSPPLD